MTKIRLEQTTSLPANTGVTWGYINDQTQSLYGAKTFANVLSASAGIECGTYFRIQTDVTSNYIAQFNALSGNAQIGLRQSASTPNVKIGHIYQRYTADNWFVGLNTTNEDFLFIRDPSGSAGISLSLNATTGAATFLSNIVTTSGNIYIGTPSDNTVGSWAQLKTGSVLATTYKIQHYEDVSGDGSAYGYVDKLTIDYLGNVSTLSSLSAVYGNLYAGLITASTAAAVNSPSLTVINTARRSILKIMGNTAGEGADKVSGGINFVDSAGSGGGSCFILWQNGIAGQPLSFWNDGRKMYLDNSGVLNLEVGGIVSAGSVTVGTDDAFYLGNSASDGTCRIVLVGGNPHIQKRIGGTFTDVLWNT